MEATTKLYSTIHTSTPYHFHKERKQRLVKKMANRRRGDKEVVQSTLICACMCFLGKPPNVLLMLAAHGQIFFLLFRKMLFRLKLPTMAMKMLLNRRSSVLCGVPSKVATVLLMVATNGHMKENLQVKLLKSKLRNVLMGKSLQ